MLWKVLEDGSYVHRAQAAGPARQVWQEGDLRHRRLRGAAQREGALRVRVGQPAPLGRGTHQGQPSSSFCSFLNFSSTLIHVEEEQGVD